MPENDREVRPLSGANSVDQPGCSIGSINCELSGLLYYVNSTDYVELNLKTGAMRAFKERGFGASAGEDGELFIATFDSSDWQDDFDLVEVYDRVGEPVTRIRIPENSAAGVHKIFNDAYLGLGFSDENGATPGLVVTTYTGEIVRYLPDDNAYITSWDWSEADKKLYITKGLSVYVADGIEGELTLVKRFDAQPFNVEVSPDGKWLALEVKEANKVSNIYVLSSDGASQHQITNSNNLDQYPRWSPDGRYLTVVSGEQWAGCTGSSCTGGCADLFVVPVDVSNPIDLKASDATPAFEVQVNTEYGVQPSTCAMSGVDWFSQ